MSLKDPNDDYDELVPEGKNRVNKFLKKTQPFIIILIIGIIIGAYIQYDYINPALNTSSTSSANTCLLTKDVLNKENACLYSLLPDPRSASITCAQRIAPQSTQTPDTNKLTSITTPKDFNEEPA